MKIASWNLNHRTLEKPIPDTVGTALESLGADVIILNEFVDGPSRTAFKQQLNDIGYSDIAISDKFPKQNQILIASRTLQRSGDLSPPGLTVAATSNFLHRKLPDLGIEIVGVRPPAYKLKSEQEQYWEQLSSIISQAKGRNILFAGDLNADPDNSKYVGGKVLDAIRKDDAWNIPNPDGEWSYISSDGKRSSRIDHVVCSSTFEQTHARYVYAIDNIVLAGPKGSNPVSDHAVLLVQVS